MDATKEQIMDLIFYQPMQIGKWVGFNDLTHLHNEWLRSFLFSSEDQTKQAHRGSYKTTVLSLFMAIHAIIKPNETVIYFRKTATDVIEISRQVVNILNSGCMHEIAKKIYGHDYKLLKSSGSEIHTTLCTAVKGSSQIVGLGIGTSITGKHADIVITDDIVNINDRISLAERNRTKMAYQELQNIKNRGGRFINTGTPWHKDDAFSLMPNIEKYDCYSTGLMSPSEIENMKESMTASLFCANYELRHVASEDLIFTERPINAPSIYIRDAYCHLDSAFFGKDYTAFTAMSFINGKFYIYGRCRRKNVQDCYTDIYNDYNRFTLGKCYTEVNADKGMVARDLKRMGIRMATYSESTNKHIKIVTYLKAIWNCVEFVEGTDPEYINMILDYNENAEHDDAPDSAACLARLLYRRAGIRLALDMSEPSAHDA